MDRLRDIKDVSCKEGHVLHMSRFEFVLIQESLGFAKEIIFPSVHIGLQLDAGGYRAALARSPGFGYERIPSGIAGAQLGGESKPEPPHAHAQLVRFK